MSVPEMRMLAAAVQSNASTWACVLRSVAQLVFCAATSGTARRAQAASARERRSMTVGMEGKDAAVLGPPNGNIISRRHLAHRSITLDRAVLLAFLSQSSRARNRGVLVESARAVPPGALFGQNRPHRRRAFARPSECLHTGARSSRCSSTLSAASCSTPLSPRSAPISFSASTAPSGRCSLPSGPAPRSCSSARTGCWCGARRAFS